MTNYSDRNIEASNDSISNKKRLLFGYNKMNSTDTYILYLTLLAMLCVFLWPSFQIITGPILTFGFIWLYINGFEPLVVAIITTANDALGTMLLGKLSFPYLLVGLLLFSLIKRNFKSKIKLAHGVSICVMLFMFIVLYFYGEINIKNIAYTYIFVFALTNVSGTKENREMLFKGVAITVFIIAVHACLTGGVEFYETGKHSSEYLRRGVLGVGKGDSNFSSLLLNIGVTCTLFDKDFRPIMKTVMLIVSVAAMAVTLSASGLLGFILVLAGRVIVKREYFPKKIKNIVLIVVLVLVAISIYANLPNEYKNSTVDAYVARMEEKLEFLESGDVASLTTNRSKLADVKMNYFMNKQSVLKILFGFNPLGVDSEKGSVPHNTYIDLLLQIGLVGTIITFLYVAQKFVFDWIDPECNRRELLLKLLILYYFMNLSIFHGSMFAMSYLILIVI